MVADPKTFEPWFEDMEVSNPLDFNGYEEKLAALFSSDLFFNFSSSLLYRFIGNLRFLSIPNLFSAIF